MIYVVVLSVSWALRVVFLYANNLRHISYGLQHLLCPLANIMNSKTLIILWERDRDRE